MIIRSIFLLLILLSCSQKVIAQDTGYVFTKPSRDGIGKWYKGREIAAVMGVGGSFWLERDTRDEEENTQLAIDHIIADPNSIIADVGAGSGYYTFRLSAKLPKGKVYALDIQEGMLDILQTRKKQLRDARVEVKACSETSLLLPPQSLDIALMVDVYHELAFPREMLESLFTCLRDNGKLILIEFRGEDPTIAIKPLHKTTVEQLNKELAASGFRLSYRGDFMAVQHFLVYEKIKPGM